MSNAFEEGRKAYEAAAPRERILTAVEATEKVYNLGRRAKDILTQRIQNNAEGILNQPLSVAGWLRAAAENLTKAAALIDSTRWPSQADYDEANREDNAHVDTDH